MLVPLSVSTKAEKLLVSTAIRFRLQRFVVLGEIKKIKSVSRSKTAMIIIASALSWLQFITVDFSQRRFVSPLHISKQKPIFN